MLHLRSGESSDELTRFGKSRVLMRPVCNTLCSRTVNKNAEAVVAQASFLGSMHEHYDTI